MAFDIGIFGGGRRQQQQQDESPFALLGEMMQMQQFGIQMQERRTLNEQRQEQIDKLRREEEDYDAMRLTVQKYTPQGDDQEADFDSAVHELYQTGR
jgi:citrate synthase